MMEAPDMEKTIKKLDMLWFAALVALLAWLGKAFYEQLLRIEHSTIEIQKEMIELRGAMLTKQDVIDIIHLEHERNGIPLNPKQ